MEARIARLEADVAHIRSDVADIKVDFRARFDTAAMFGGLAHGFGWI
jgi:hypothetical protein